jgi:hypothetical protein
MRRLASCFVDHVIFSILAGIVTLPGLIYEMMQHMFEVRLTIGNIFLNTIGLSIYLCKDALFVRSFGKQIFGLDLVRNDFKQRPSAFQAYIRNLTAIIWNLTAIIWPVEILMLAYTPAKRTGDYIAKTRVTDQVLVDTEGPSTVSRMLIFLGAMPISYAIMLGMARTMTWLNEVLIS